MRRSFLFFLLSFVFCSVLASQTIEQKLTELQSSIVLQLQDSKMQLTTMENRLTDLSQILDTTPNNLEQELLALKLSWNNILLQLENCYTDINSYKSLLTLKDFTIKKLTITITVLIVLIVIKIIVKIINVVLALKGIQLPRFLEIIL